MLLQFWFFPILLLPLIYGANNTVQHTQNILNDTVTLLDTLSNKTNNILVTEGGAITNVTLQYDKNPELAMDKELGTSKDTSSVKARKGVLPEEFAISTADNSTHVNDHQNISINKVNNSTSLKKNDIKSSNNNTRTNSSIVEDIKTTVKPHKPLVLSYEELSGMNHKGQSKAVPSSKPIVSDQIPNPNLDNLKIKTVESNQPGMIMPIVITILTAPLLVVLGYMALSRGREAWKNRHYKRMDFLLDGMYND